MNKTELIEAMMAKAQLSKKDTEKALKAFEAVVSEELANGGKVQLVGFGTFKTAERKERIGTNPKTKEPMIIEGGIYPKFTPGKALKDCVRGEAQ